MKAARMAALLPAMMGLAYAACGGKVIESQEGNPGGSFGASGGVGVCLTCGGGGSGGFGGQGGGGGFGGSEGMMGGGSGGSVGGSGAQSTVDSGSNDSSGGDVSPADSGVEIGDACTPGTQQCSGGGAVQICNGNGEWGNTWTCTTGTCSEGACTGSTAGTTNLSCAAGGPGMTNCGPGGSGTESCCTSLEVPGGTYYRTYNLEGSTSGPPDGGWYETDPATISGFRLDKYDVTVGRFRQFVAAWNNGAGYTPAMGSGKHTHLNGGKGLVNVGTAGGYEPGWVTTDSSNISPTTANLLTYCNDIGTLVGTAGTWTNTASTQENLPINCVNWFESYAFCIWDGGFLPSEAEWEYAAAGGSEQLVFPWGSAAPDTSNQYAIYDCNYPPGSDGCSGVTNIAPVGTASAGAGAWGQLDLAGNVFQWNLDWYQDYVACTDCSNLSPILSPLSSRVIHGGFFYGSPMNLLPPLRVYVPPAYGEYYLGFRCARTP
jgi:sulfatase modifying factor 1